MTRAEVHEQITPGIPETGSTIAKSLDVDVHQDTVVNRLKELQQLGKIETKKVGPRSRAWWIPSPDTTVTPDMISDSMFRSGKDPGILRVLIRTLNDDTEPITSGEIAEQVEDSRDIIYNRLVTLEERGWVESLKTGSTSMVWRVNPKKVEVEAGDDSEADSEVTA